MLSNKDLTNALDCVRQLVEAKNHDEFVDVLVHVMHPLMRAKVTGYNEADVSRKRFAFVLHPKHFVTDVMIKAWVDHAHQNPLIQNMQKNPTDFSVHKITDFVDQKEFRKTGLCQKVYLAMDTEYQIAMPFAVPGTAAIAVVFNRDKDFTERDREILTLLQPIITAAYLNVQRLTDLQLDAGEASISVTAVAKAVKKSASVKPPLLTQRQTQVFRLLVQGRTNKQIAMQLKLSVRTIEKYVEHLLRKLKVPTRAAACAQYQTQLREAG